MLKIPSLRLAASLAVSLLPLLCLAEEVNVVTVTTKDNSKVHFIAATHPHVSFTGDGVTFKFTNIDNQENWPEFSYPLDDFASITYGREDRSLTGTDGPVRSEVLFNVTDAVVEAGGLPSGSVMTVCSAAGVDAGHAKVGPDGSARVDISRLAPGVYVVATVAATYKFVKP